MKKSIIIILLICFGKIFAQDSLSFNKKYMAKNNVSIDLGGVGSFYSVNYERNFFIKDNSFHTFRVGASYSSYAFSDDNLINLPIAYTYNIGKKKSKFFVGMGFTFLIALDPDSPAAIRQVKQNPQTAGHMAFLPLDFSLSPMIGYELISKKTFYFKAYATALIGRSNFIYYYALPWAGFTFGFKLNKHK